MATASRNAGGSERASDLFWIAGYWGHGDKQLVINMLDLKNFFNISKYQIYWVQSQTHPNTLISLPLILRSKSYQHKSHPFLVTQIHLLLGWYPFYCVSPWFTSRVRHQRFGWHGRLAWPTPRQTQKCCDLMLRRRSYWDLPMGDPAGSETTHRCGGKPTRYWWKIWLCMLLIYVLIPRENTGYSWKSDEKCR